MTSKPLIADKLPATLALIAGTIAALGLLGWALNLPRLTQPLPELPGLSVVSAYTLLFATAALLLLHRSTWLRIVGKLAAGLVLWIGAITLAEHAIAPEVAYPDLHALLAFPFFSHLSGHAIHPSPHTAFGFCLLAGALLLANGKRKWQILGAQWFAILVIVEALSVVTGYLFEAHHLYRSTPDLGMSPSTALALLALAGGVLASQPKRGLMTLLTAALPGGAMLRLLLPATLLLPPLAGWLIVLGADAGWYDPRLVPAMITVLLMAAGSLGLLAMGRRLNRNSAALHRSKELLEKTFDATHTLVAYLDRDFNFLKVNAAYAAADHKVPADFPDKNHFDLYPNRENEDIFRHVVASGEPYICHARPFEYPGQPERGVTYWDWGLYPVFTRDGAVEGLVLNLRDVTDREQAEQQRIDAEARFHQLFNTASDAILIHGLNGRFVEVNDIACQRLGYSREELLELGPAGIDTPEFANRVAERTRQLRTTGQLVFESAHVAKDGRIIPVEISSRLIEFGGQRAALSIARDITERKATEAALRQNREATDALINATTESAVLMAVDGNVLAINRIGAKRLKSTPEAIVGRNVYELFPPDLAASRRQMVDQVVRGRQPLIAEDSRHGIQFEHHLYPIFDERGQVVQIALYAKDITETRQAQAIDGLIHSLDQQVLRGSEPDSILRFACDEMVKLFDLPFVWIGRKEADGRIAISAWAGRASEYQQHLVEIGVRWDDSPQGHGPSGLTIRSGRQQLFKLDSPGFDPWRAAANKYGFHAILGLPLLVNGNIYGALTLYSSHGNTFDNPHSQERFSGVATRLSMVLEMAYEHDRIRLLSAALASASNGVFITDPTGRIEWLNAAFSRLSGYSADEALGRTPRLLHSGQQDKAYYQKLWQTILAGETWSAETVERHKDATLFTVQQTITPIRDRQGKISHFVSIMEDITAKKATEAIIHRMAHFDALTDLPNRATFDDRLSQAIAMAKRGEHQVALLFLDLDKFKSINDSLGHHVGDLLLKGVAQRLLDCVRETDTVARLAGDEFTVILPQVETEADAEAVAQKIINRLTEPFLLDGHEVRTAASIGIALYPSHAQDEEALIRLADSAMYAAKAGGCGRYCLHKPDQVSPAG
ncbi:MAG: PAS domain S-box protein [Betaproteobacteria bacterium]|nr:PAS domain S-box protein [Betaproteobacteria bacterium]